MFSLVSTGVRWLFVGLPLVALLACTPGDNWRELSWPAGRVAAQFPCKPEQVERGPALMARCEANGLQFALAWQPLDTPDQAKATLQALVKRFGDETRVSAERTEGALPSGALAWPEAGRFAWRAPTQAVHVMTWPRGLTVYQATVVAVGSDAGAASTTAATADRFFNGVRSLP